MAGQAGCARLIAAEDEGQEQDKPHHQNSEAQGRQYPTGHTRQRFKLAAQNALLPAAVFDLRIEGENSGET